MFLSPAAQLRAARPRRLSERFRLADMHGSNFANPALCMGRSESLSLSSARADPGFASPDPDRSLERA